MEILRDFHRITGSHISIFSTDFEIIACYPKELSPFCSAIQSNVTNLNLCKKSDYNALCHVRHTAQPYIYTCPCGLTEVIAPIFNYGEISGYFMMGQITVDRIENSAEIVQLSQSRFPSPEMAEKLCAAVPRIPEYLLQSYINILKVLAEYLTQNHKVQTERPDLLSAVRQYIQRYYNTPISIDSICSIFHCSHATLTNRFKEKYNITILQCIHQCRLARAERELKNSEKSIKEIAVNCGFPDNNYFTKVFSKAYGETPTSYRKKHSNKHK